MPAGGRPEPVSLLGTMWQPLQAPSLKTFVICQGSAGPPHSMVRDQVQGLNKLALAHAGSALSADAKAETNALGSLGTLRKEGGKCPGTLRLPTENTA